MIEFTVTEFVLLCWAVVSTAYGMKWREGKRMADQLIHNILSNKELRDELVKGYEKITS